MQQRSPANSESSAVSSPSQRPAADESNSPVSALTAALVDGSATQTVEDFVVALSRGAEAELLTATQVLQELLQHKPELLAPHIEALIGLLGSSRAPAAQCAARCLPVLARVTPAKVAKHLKTMQAALPSGSDTAKDGLVRTFVALCVASVTYQKRLIDSFELALRTASASQLPAWAEHILPALKGEPYAQARTVVEQRLPAPELPREVAQRIADFLGVKLRPPRT
jgi:hypothetical protein